MISLQLTRRPPTSTLFPYTTLFRSWMVDLSVISTEAIDADPGRLTQLFTNVITNAFRHGHVDKPVRIHRSEEHTSELQSHVNLVCRLLLEKKKIEDIDGVLDDCLPL